MRLHSTSSTEIPRIFPNEDVRAIGTIGGAQHVAFRGEETGTPAMQRQSKPTLLAEQMHAARQNFAPLLITQQINGCLSIVVVIQSRMLPAANYHAYRHLF